MKRELVPSQEGFYWLLDPLSQITIVHLTPFEVTVLNQIAGECSVKTIMQMKELGTNEETYLTPNKEWNCIDNLNYKWSGPLYHPMYKE